MNYALKETLTHHEQPLVGKLHFHCDTTGQLLPKVEPGVLGLPVLLHNPTRRLTRTVVRLSLRSRTKNAEVESHMLFPNTWIDNPKPGKWVTFWKCIFFHASCLLEPVSKGNKCGIPSQALVAMVNRWFSLGAIPHASHYTPATCIVTVHYLIISKQITFTLIWSMIFIRYTSYTRMSKLRWEMTHSLWEKILKENFTIENTIVLPCHAKPTSDPLPTLNCRLVIRGCWSSLSRVTIVEPYFIGLPTCRGQYRGQFYKIKRRRLL